MYRLSIYLKEGEKFGLVNTTKEFYLNSAGEVCGVIKSLSSCKMVYTLEEVNCSSVDEVLNCFLAKEV